MAAVLMVFLLALPACPSSCQQVTPTGDEIADCAAESARDIFHTLLPRVSTVIATGPNLASVAIALAKLTAEYGVEVVTCVVDAVRDRNGQAAAVASGDEKQLHERSETLAAQWLAEHGAQIKQQ
jgi:hypothetical protein